jgi:hypothetical protein
VGKVFLAMVANYTDMHVLPKLMSVTTISISFDLRMYRGGVCHTCFGYQYLTKAWEPMHAIVGCLK